jgi:hypothetical protein
VVRWQSPSSLPPPSTSHPDMIHFANNECPGFCERTCNTDANIASFRVRLSRVYAFTLVIFTQRNVAAAHAPLRLVQVRIQSPAMTSAQMADVQTRALAPTPTAKMKVLLASVGLLLLLAHPPTTRHPHQARLAPADLHLKYRGRTLPICLQLARAYDSGVAGLVEAALRPQLPLPLLF